MVTKLEKLEEIILEVLREKKEFDSIASLFRYLVFEYEHKNRINFDIHYDEVRRIIHKLADEGIVKLVPSFDKRKLRVIYCEPPIKDIEELVKKAKEGAIRETKRYKRKLLLKSLVIIVALIISLLYNHMLFVGELIGIVLLLLYSLWVQQDFLLYRHYTAIAQMSDEELRELFYKATELPIATKIFEDLLKELDA